MRITITTDDGRRVSYRPEDVLEDIAGQVIDGKLSHAAAKEQIKFAFPGMSPQWYAEITEGLDEL